MWVKLAQFWPKNGKPLLERPWHPCLPALGRALCLLIPLIGMYHPHFSRFILSFVTKSGILGGFCHLCYFLAVLYGNFLAIWENLVFLDVRCHFGYYMAVLGRVFLCQIGSVLTKEWETAVRNALTPVLAGAGPGAMPTHSSHWYVSPSFHEFCFVICDKILYFGRF